MVRARNATASGLSDAGHTSRRKLIHPFAHPAGTCPGRFREPPSRDDPRCPALVWRRRRHPRTPRPDAAARPRRLARLPRGLGGDRSDPQPARPGRPGHRHRGRLRHGPRRRRGRAPPARSAAARAHVEARAAEIATARPTAVNLRWAVERCLHDLEALPPARSRPHSRPRSSELPRPSTRRTNNSAPQSAGTARPSCPRAASSPIATPAGSPPGAPAPPSRRSPPRGTKAAASRSSPTRPGHCCRAPVSPRGNWSSGAFR